MSSLDLKKDFNYSETGVTGTVTKNSITNIDLKVTESHIYLNGGRILYENAVFGDYLTFQVVDIDNVLGYGANTVLAEFIHKRYIDPNSTQDSMYVPYAAFIPQNTYVRLKYTSIGTSTDVNVAVNYFFHELNV